MDNRWDFKCSSRYNFACEKENNLEFTGTGADCSVNPVGVILQP